MPQQCIAAITHVAYVGSGSNTVATQMLKRVDARILGRTASTQRVLIKLSTYDLEG